MIIILGEIKKKLTIQLIYMQFTQEQKNQYLDKLALATKQCIWQTDMALMKAVEKINKKKALLTIIEQKIENKEYKLIRIK